MSDHNDRWNNPPQVPTDPSAFKRLRLAQTFLLTYRAIPIVLMGDEFGMPGGGDPDNRRMMKFGNDLTALQKQTLQVFSALGKARAAHTALRRGGRSTLAVENEFYAYARTDGSDVAVVVMNLSQNPVSRSVDVSSLGASGTLTDVVSGGSVPVSGGHIAVNLDSQSAALYVR